MSPDEGARDALFRDPLPEGFSRRVFRVAPGLELGLEPGCLPDAIVVVEQGELELECRAGTCRRFGRGSMFPIALLPVSHLRNVGPGPLVLVAVSRARLRATDEFRYDAGSYGDGSKRPRRGTMNALADQTSISDDKRTTRRTAARDVGGLAERADALRRLHMGPRPLVLPNAWDVASARLVVTAGFPVVATSSGAIAATLGYEDSDSMPVDEAFGVIARITGSVSVSVPVTADVEAGYRLSPEDLVERLLEAGAVGCNLEDTDHHGGAGLVDAGENAERLRAARHAATEAGVDIVLNARVDVLRLEGDRRDLFEEAVRRARLYLRAGADCVFPIRLADDELIREFVRRVEGPVNVVAAGAPPLARLAELGVARVSFAGFLMNQLYGAHEAKLCDISAEVAAIA
jgi:2-methylisocitrate lyase-like PEP mutase family enzyme